MLRRHSVRTTTLETLLINSLPSVRYLQALHVYPHVDIVRAAKQARIYFVTGPRLLHVLRTTTELSKAAALNLGVAESDLPEVRRRAPAIADHASASPLCP